MGKLPLAIKDSPLLLAAVQSMQAGKCLDLRYHGKRRLVEVHAVGLSAKGEPVIRAYQVVGGSVYSDTVGWKLFSIKEMEEVSETEFDSQAPRPGYKPNDAGMGTVFAEVSKHEVPNEQEPSG